MSDDGRIGFPPGMTPPPTDSRTVPIDRAVRPEIVFRPMPPGVPPPPTEPVPLVGWALRVPGVPMPVPVAGAIVIGRNPAPPREWPDAATLAVADPARSVSKTHAIVDLDAGRLRVVDLHSTNGVRLLCADGAVVQVASGTPVEIPDDAAVQLGEFVIRVDRA